MSIEQVFWGSMFLLVGLELISGWLARRSNRRAHALRDHLLRCDPDEALE
jgi:hypothetical protein